MAERGSCRASAGALDNRTERIVASSTYSELAGVVPFLETESPEH
jgi:hypothetical protein